MRNIEKVIILLIVLIVIIMCLLMKFIAKNDTTNTLNEIEIVDDVIENEEVIDNTIERIEDRSDFFAVKSCVSKFYTYYADSFSTDSLSNQGIKAVYNMLDKKYIEDNEITEQNLVSKLSKINTSRVNINDMYVDQKNENIYIYIVKGKLREIETKKVADFELMLMLDMKNSTFTVFLNDYINKYYNNMQRIEGTNIDVPERIEENNYNTFDYKVINDEEYVRELMARYKEEMLNDKQNAYNHLDEEYKEKRFEDFSDFEAYAKANTKKNVILKLAQYRKKIYDDYTEYVCVDTKGNYYIFKEESVMNYGMILDTYTVDLPDFIEKYDKESKEQKAALNLNKIIMAINEKDYKYVYNKLNNTYKNTYFTDYNVFVTYLTNNFYSSNEMKIKKMESVGQNTYNATITVTNTNNAEETKELILIVRLLEDRNFEMSFGIK